MRYERLFPLGSGGMATVELALAKGPGGFNRLVVLKSMRKELATTEDAYRMFLEEARLSARLNHPNVVQVSEVVESPEGIILVMEYLDGAPLSNVYRTANEALTLPMRLRLLCEVLAGLHYAHELADFKGTPLGIVHRDVSPQNVFVTYDGRIKLLDFGIAKATNSSEQTRAGFIKGRLAYMPAEQLTGGAIDRRTDVYAVGCLLWEAIAGSRMWADQTERDIARGVLAGKVPQLSSRVKVDPELESIVMRATSLEQGRRQASAEQMRSELESYLTKTFPQVTARDIGDMLSSKSGSARDERRRAISEAIARIEGESNDSSPGAPAPGATGSNPGLTGMRLKSVPGSGTDSGSISRQSITNPMSQSSSSGLTIQDAPRSNTKSSSAPRPSPLGRRAAPFIGVAITLVAAVVWFKSGAEPAPATPALPVSAPPVTNAARTLRVEATPEDARIFIDDHEAKNPATLSVSSGSEHIVRVEHEGYEPNVRKVSVSDDMAMRVELAAQQPHEEASAKPASGKGKARVAPVARPVAATPGVAKPQAAETKGKNCDPPFYFSNGNKTYKPECI